MFVCLGFGNFILFIFFLGREAHRSAKGCQFFKNVDFLDQHPLKVIPRTASISASIFIIARFY